MYVIYVLHHRSQIEYAMRDVQHLHSMHDFLYAEMTKLDRHAWFDEDMQTALLVFILDHINVSHVICYMLYIG